MGVPKQSLFEAVGGLKTLEAVHKIFYDKIYAHLWMQQFFEGHDQSLIELRQTQFMGMKFGGDIDYPGMDLALAHRRMYITPELFQVRQGLLRDSLREFGLAEDLIVRWLKIDQAFSKPIINPSLEDFECTDFKYEKPLIVPNPSLIEAEE
ncbi:MAG: group 1 truncated hemoglobin [Zetaproteobacteria bacterium]|nr:group 1 truncated hemoglobin [Zetaproteobacteria bacterium]